MGTNALKQGDLVKYIGHTDARLETGCSNLMPNELLGKIYAVSAMPPDETSEVLAVSVTDGNSVESCFLMSHLEPVPAAPDQYQEGYRAGMQQAAKLAESPACTCKEEHLHDGCCGSCGTRIVKVIRNEKMSESQKEWKGCLSEVYLDGTPIQCQKEFGHSDKFHSSEGVEDYLSGVDPEIPIKRNGAIVLIQWMEL